MVSYEQNSMASKGRSLNRKAQYPEKKPRGPSTRAIEVTYKVHNKIFKTTSSLSEAGCLASFPYADHYLT